MDIRVRKVQIGKYLLLFLVVLCMGAQAFAQQINKKTVDTTIILDDKKVVMEQKLLKLEDAKGGFSQTLQSYMLKDVAGKVHFKREFPKAEVREGETGFMAQFEIAPAVISTPKKQALRISHGAYPSAPGSGVDYQLFVWQEDSLIALSDQFSNYGRFGDFSRTVEQIDVKLSDTEIMLMTHHIAHYFYADIPVLINFDPSAKKSFRTVLKKDPKSNLDIIPVTAKRDSSFMYGDQPTKITLYQSATGKKSSQVTVDRKSNIEIGSAYGNTSISDSGGGHVSVEIKRLKVTVDGKKGFIEEKDYRKIGLPVFG